MPTYTFTNFYCYRNLSYVQNSIFLDPVIPTEGRGWLQMKVWWYSRPEAEMNVLHFFSLLVSVFCEHWLLTAMVSCYRSQCSCLLHLYMYLQGLNTGALTISLYHYPSSSEKVAMPYQETAARMLQKNEITKGWNYSKTFFDTNRMWDMKLILISMDSEKTVNMGFFTIFNT